VDQPHRENCDDDSPFLLRFNFLQKSRYDRGGGGVGNSWRSVATHDFGTRTEESLDRGSYSESSQNELQSQERCPARYVW
jgi:hypothetical protein